MAAKKKRKPRNGRYDWPIAAAAIIFILLLLAGAGHSMSLTFAQCGNIETGDVGTCNSTMDIRCSTALNCIGAVSSKITPVNRARVAVDTNSRGTLMWDWTDINNSYQHRWGTSAVKLTLCEEAGDFNLPTFVYLVTNAGKYARLASGGSGDGSCTITLINVTGPGGPGGSHPLSTMISSTPYFNGTSGLTTPTNILSFQANQTVAFLFSAIDGGYMLTNDSTFLTFDPTTFGGVAGMSFFYDDKYHALVMINGSYALGASCPGDLCKSGLSYGDKAQLNYLSCGDIARSNITTSPQGGINYGPTQFDYTCWNNDGAGIPNTGAGFSVNESVQLPPPATRPNFRVNTILYNYSSFFQITGVQFAPNNPQAGQNVTVQWHTSLSANSYLFWRYRNYSSGNGEVNYTTWSVSYSAISSINHALDIPGDQIYDGKVYQFYVQSGDINDTRLGLYYNFTVGSLSNLIDTPGAMLPAAVSNLENTGLCSGSSCLYIAGITLFFILGLILFWFGGLRYGAMGSGALLIVLCLIGWLPSFLLIPLIILAVVWIINALGIFGGGSSDGQ